MAVPKLVQHWLNLRAQYERQAATGRDPAMPRVLPIARIGRRWYFVDERLRELRNVLNPTDVLQFESDSDLLVFLGQHGFFNA